MYKKVVKKRSQVRLALEWGDPGDPLPGVHLDCDPDSPETDIKIAAAKAAARRRRDDAKRSGDFLALIFCYIRQHRWAALYRLVRTGVDVPLGKLFRAVWIDSEDIWRERKIVNALVRLVLEGRQQRNLFTEEDWRRFSELPKSFVVYRGSKAWNRVGMSWTLDPFRAAYFASHHCEGFGPMLLDPRRAGEIREITVSKSDVLFFTSEREEEEIVLRRFRAGRHSDAGQLELARYYGPHAFWTIKGLRRKDVTAYVAELKKFPREVLSPLIVDAPAWVKEPSVTSVPDAEHHVTRPARAFPTGRSALSLVVTLGL